MKEYIDKNDKIVKEEDYILMDEKVCQALKCDDGTLLYEEMRYNFNKGEVEIINEPNYPDAYEPFVVEIISYNKAVKLLRTRDIN
jgi:hypothetical protein